MCGVSVSVRQRERVIRPSPVSSTSRVSMLAGLQASHRVCRRRPHPATAGTGAAGQKQHRRHQQQGYRLIDYWGFRERRLLGHRYRRTTIQHRRMTTRHRGGGLGQRGATAASGDHSGAVDRRRSVEGGVSKSKICLGVRKENSS